MGSQCRGAAPHSLGAPSVFFRGSMAFIRQPSHPQLVLCFSRPSHSLSSSLSPEVARYYKNDPPIQRSIPCGLLFYSCMESVVAGCRSSGRPLHGGASTANRWRTEATNGECTLTGYSLKKPLRNKLSQVLPCHVMSRYVFGWWSRETTDKDRQTWPVVPHHIQHASVIFTDF